MLKLNSQITFTTIWGNITGKVEEFNDTFFICRDKSGAFAYIYPTFEQTVNTAPPPSPAPYQDNPPPLNLLTLPSYQFSIYFSIISWASHVVEYTYIRVYDINPTDELKLVPVFAASTVVPKATLMYSYNYVGIPSDKIIALDHRGVFIDDIPWPNMGMYFRTYNMPKSKEKVQLIVYKHPFKINPSEEELIKTSKNTNDNGWVFYNVPAAELSLGIIVAKK